MPSERQWQAAEQKAEYYNSKISEYHKNYVEKDDSREYTEVEVFIPLTEDINQNFRIMAPCQYAEEGLRELQAYFSEHICPIDPIKYVDRLKPGF